MRFSCGSLYGINSKTIKFDEPSLSSVSRNISIIHALPTFCFLSISYVFIIGVCGQKCKNYRHKNKWGQTPKISRCELPWKWLPEGEWIMRHPSLGFWHSSWVTGILINPKPHVRMSEFFTLSPGNLSDEWLSDALQR